MAAHYQGSAQQTVLPVNSFIFSLQLNIGRLLVEKISLRGNFNLALPVFQLMCSLINAENY